MLKYLLKNVRQSGNIAMHYYGRLKEQDIEYKNPVDMVTVADKTIESFLKKKLSEKYPDVFFLAEESNAKNLEHNKKMFIVDPIDGTTNFVHNYPLFSISLAYRENNETKIGIVYLPYFKSLYHAEKGKGAFCNGKRIQVSRTDKLINALVVTGFACIRDEEKIDNMEYFRKVIYQARGVRRDGSAAIDLCYVAQGTFDLFWEMSLSPWDIAAGVLLVQEAGGMVTDYDNQSAFEEKKRLLASNGLLHQEFLKLIKE